MTQNETKKTGKSAIALGILGAALGVGAAVAYKNPKVKKMVDDFFSDVKVEADKVKKDVTAEVKRAKTEVEKEVNKSKENLKNEAKKEVNK